VPKILLHATSSKHWLIQLNNTNISAKSTIKENDYTSIYFTYNLSTYEVRIRAIMVTDFTPYVIGGGVAIAVIAIAIFVILRKKRTIKTE